MRASRRAKFYSLSHIGRKKIHDETENWERIAATTARFLAPSYYYNDMLITKHNAGTVCDLRPGV